MYEDYYGLSIEEINEIEKRKIKYFNNDLFKDEYKELDFSEINT
jgi:hypothetical protein